MKITLQSTDRCGCGIKQVASRPSVVTDGEGTVDMYQACGYSDLYVVCLSPSKRFIALRHSCTSTVNRLKDAHCDISQNTHNLLTKPATSRPCLPSMSSTVSHQIKFPASCSRCNSVIMSHLIMESVVQRTTTPMQRIYCLLHRAHLH